MKLAPILCLPIAVALAGPPEAEACSYLPSPIGAIAPKHGDTGVPLNAVLLVAFHGVGAARYRVEYQVAGGPTLDLGVVPNDRMDTAQGPHLPLPAGVPTATASLTLTPLEGFGFGYEVIEATFTYGGAADDTPPTAPPAPRLDLRSLDATNNSCGPQQDGERVLVEEPTGLPSDAAGYGLFVRRAPVDAPGTTPPVLSTLEVVSDLPPLDVGFFADPTDVCVSARLMDQAGQWGPASPESCVRVNGGGCQSVGGSLPSLAGLALLLGVAALRRRRA